MHEFSLAQAVVETVLRVAREHGAVSIEEVNLEVGEVALVNMDQLQWHMRMLAQGTIAQDALFKWVLVRATICCGECGYEGPISHEAIGDSSHSEVPVFQCPHCGSPHTRILKGRELRIVDIHAKFPDEEGGDHA